MKTEKIKYMNKQEQDILNEMISDKYINQRYLAETSRYS